MIPLKNNRLSLAIAVALGSVTSFSLSASVVSEAVNSTVLAADQLSVPLTQQSSASQLAMKKRVVEALTLMPLRFEENQGQVDERVRYLARGSGYTLMLLDDEVVISLRDENSDKKIARANQISMKLEGANQNPKISSEDVLPGKTNYLIGQDTAKHQTNISSFKRVRYQSTYPGIDVVYYGKQGKLEYDFVVAPGKSVDTIKMAFSGTEAVKINQSGDLVLTTSGGELTQPAPFSYQEVNGERVEVPSKFVLLDDHKVGFEVAAYDANKPLVIDPAIQYSSYFGGASDENNSAGHFADIAVAKYGAYVGDPRPSTLFGSTYTAGTGKYGVADNTFKIKVNGVTSNAISLSAGAAPANMTALAALLQTAINSDSVLDALDTANDVVVTVDPSATRLKIYSTNGNLSSDMIEITEMAANTQSNFGLTVKKAGTTYAYVTGYTASTDLPTTGFPVTPYSVANTGKNDIFVVKIMADNTGTTLQYQTYLGGTGNDYGHGIAVDSQGAAYIVGESDSNDYPLGNSATSQKNKNKHQLHAGLGSQGGVDAVVSKITPTGESLAWSTYLGGVGNDGGYGISARFDAGYQFDTNDDTDNVYVTGYTESAAQGSDFRSGGAYQSANGGGKDVFFTKLTRTRVSDTSGGTGSGNYKGGAVSMVFPATINTSAADSDYNLSNYAISVSDGQSTIGFSGATFGQHLAGTYATATALAIGLDTLLSTKGDAARDVYYDIPNNRFTIINQTVTSAGSGANGQGRENTYSVISATSEARAMLGLQVGRGTPMGLTVTYGTFLGGAQDDSGKSIVEDSDGYAYVAGTTMSADYDTVKAGQPVYGGGESDGFVSRILADEVAAGSLAGSPSAESSKTLDWSTFVGGSGVDEAYALDIYNDGSTNYLYVAGYTASATDFPGTDETDVHAGSSDAFITKIFFDSDADASSQKFSNFIGGTGTDVGYGVAVDGSGNAFVVGETQSADLVVVEPLQKDANVDGDFVDGSDYDQSLLQGNSDAFVAKVDNDAAGTVSFLSYLGGDALDSAHSVALDTEGNQYVTGMTTSVSYPSLDAMISPTSGTATYDFSANKGGADAFVTRLATYDQVKLSVDPKDIAAAPGSAFSVIVKVDSGNQPVDTVGVKLTFDATKLRLIGGSKAGAGFDTILPAVINSSAANTDGEVSIVATMAAGTSTALAQAKGYFELYTLNFQTIAAAGNATDTLAFDEPNTFVTVAGGKNLIFKKTSGAVTIGGRLLNGSVSLEGRPEAPNDSYKSTIYVQVPNSAAGTANGACGTAPGCKIVTDNTGAFSLPLNGSGIAGVDIAESGDHYVLIKGAHTLRIKRSVNFDDNVVNVSFASALREGDTTAATDTVAPSYNKVDLVDFSYFVSKLGGTDTQSDFNQDGTVDLTDFSLLASNFGASGLSKPSVDSVASVPSQVVSLSLSPESASVTAGDVVDVTVRVNAAGQAVDAVGAFLNFDPAVLSVESIEGSGPMDTVLQSSYSNSEGSISYQAGTLSQNFPDGNFDLLTIRFRTKGAMVGPVASVADDSTALRAGNNVFSHVGEVTALTVNESADDSTGGANPVTESEPTTSGFGCSVATAPGAIDPLLPLLTLSGLLFLLRRRKVSCEVKS
jgi:hypothetical protein